MKRLEQVLSARAYLYRYEKWKRRHSPEAAWTRSRRVERIVAGESHTYAITVPRAQSYELRPKRPSIRERWVRELVEEKRREHDEAVRYQPFRAHDIPYRVLDRGYYGRMCGEREERRRRAKEDSKARTEQLVQPFSFADRDATKPKRISRPTEEYLRSKDAECKVEFRAKPVPWICSVKLYQRKREEEAEQSEVRRKVRRQWLESNSSLPPRMQMHLEQERLKTEHGKSKSGAALQFTFMPAKPKKIPDFARLHQRWERALTERRSQKVLTRPIEPTFHESTKKPELRFLDEAPPKREDPIESTESV